MGHAEARVYGDRIAVKTFSSKGIDDFDFMLAASKKVLGGRWDGDRKLWHYPLSVSTCAQLRAAFGEHLRVGDDLAVWYRSQSAVAGRQAGLSAAHDVELSIRVPKRFREWLRPRQRVGAQWIAQGYRGAGLIADMPGVGKTTELLAALLEADVQGPVLVVAPRKSVRVVWGREIRTHLRGVPVYLCRGTRKSRDRVLARFTADMQEDPNRLRIVVVVAEMLRVELGNPCYTVEEVIGEDGICKDQVAKNKVSGMCPAKRRGETCKLHKEVKVAKKDRVPVGFSYPEIFDSNILGGGWAWTVLDESHKLLGSLSVTKGNLMGKGLRLMNEREDRRRYAMSGSPFGKAGRAQGLFGTLNWLWPDEYTSYWKWVADKFEVEDQVIGYDRYRRVEKTAKKILGLKGVPFNATADQEAEAWERFLAELGPRILRRTKQEVFEDLPPKSYVEVPCELTAAQKRQWNELRDYAEITTPTGIIAANGNLALNTRAKQIAMGELVVGKDGKATFGDESGKLDRLWDALETRGILDGLPGPKMVVACRYNEFLDTVAEFLNADGVSYFQMDGRTSDTKADQMMTAWQEGTCTERVFLVNTKAGGVSINLDAADEMHMLDEDTDPGVNEQMEDRIHRGSRMHKVVVFYYRTEGTFEYAQAHDTEYRRRVQHAVLDGRRGVEDTRALMRDAERFTMYSEDVA